jgi:hypothetical protein
VPPSGDTEAAETAIAEARDIATQLRCQPLIDRTETIETISSRAAAS